MYTIRTYIWRGVRPASVAGASHVDVVFELFQVKFFSDFAGQTSSSVSWNQSSGGLITDLLLATIRLPNRRLCGEPLFPAAIEVWWC